MIFLVVEGNKINLDFIIFMISMGPRTQVGQRQNSHLLSLLAVIVSSAPSAYYLSCSLLSIIYYIQVRGIFQCMGSEAGSSIFSVPCFPVRSNRSTSRVPNRPITPTPDSKRLQASSTPIGPDPSPIFMEFLIRNRSTQHHQISTHPLSNGSNLRVIKKSSTSPRVLSLL